MYLSNHPNVSEWFNAFQTRMQMELCRRDISLGAVNEMTNDQCPCLGLFRNAYNLDAVQWMVEQICVINTIPNVKNRLNDEQLYTLAEDIFREYPYYNLADVCIFLGRLRRGRHGSFYNSINNVMIMEALIDFDRYRWQEIDVYERQKTELLRSEKIKAQKKDSVTFEEFSELLILAKSGDKEAVKKIRYNQSEDYSALEKFTKNKLPILEIK